MKTSNKIKSFVIICLILLFAGSLFFGGMALADRYQNTIVNTYNKYYYKYYGRAKDFIDKGYEQIVRHIEMASQQYKNKDLQK